MRLGVLSDTHANIEALEAVFSALAHDGVDQIYCLGDTVGYGASPNDCCDLVRSKVAATVIGNHDAAVAGRMDYSYYYHAARHALDQHARQLKPENMAWLKGLPYEHEAEGIHLCHGSPVSVQEFDYIFARDQAAQCLPMWERMAPLTLIGHSHLCKAFALDRERVHEIVSGSFELRPGFKYVVSVGSVGQPRDYDPRAGYIIFDTVTRQFEYRRVEYDVKSSADKVFASNLEPNFGHRLFLGI